MTYCVALRLNDGLVFLSDSRTNAGVDQIGTYRKMNVYEIPGERVMVLMTAGNLSISQSIRQIVADRSNAELDAANGLRRCLAIAGRGDELAAEELRVASQSLGRLLGRIDVEDVLDAIFREFCIGK